MFSSKRSSLSLSKTLIAEIADLIQKWVAQHDGATLSPPLPLPNCQIEERCLYTKFLSVFSSNPSPEPLSEWTSSGSYKSAFPATVDENVSRRDATVFANKRKCWASSGRPALLATAFLSISPVVRLSLFFSHCPAPVPFLRCDTFRRNDFLLFAKDHNRNVMSSFNTSSSRALCCPFRLISLNLAEETNLWTAISFRILESGRQLSAEEINR